jgi:hypothetical protein
MLHDRKDMIVSKSKNQLDIGYELKRSVLFEFSEAMEIIRTHLSTSVSISSYVRIDDLLGVFRNVWEVCMNIYVYICIYVFIYV